MAHRARRTPSRLSTADAARDTEAPHYHATAALEAEIAGLRQGALPVAGYNYGGNWTVPTGGTPARWIGS